MINNIRFKIIAGKNNKISEFYTIFARQMPDYIIRQRDRGRGRCQSFEAEAEAETKILASRPLWPRGLNITESALSGRFIFWGMMILFSVVTYL